VATIGIAAFVSGWATSPFGPLDREPWAVTRAAEELVAGALSGLAGGYRVEAGIALHETAMVEGGATLKPPAIIGPQAFVAAGAYLRGGVFLDSGVIVGPNAEIKSSFLFAGAKLAHLNFVGDSILGAGVNLEAGAMIANYRNEMEDKIIRIRFEGDLVDTHGDKFGALVGDGVRIGANAVVAPGALIRPGVRLGRLALLDQHPLARH
jgi:NDP-sugar pyrophosphorylase family protein